MDGIRHEWVGGDGDKNVVSSPGELRFGNVAIESISTADIYEFALEILRLAAENERLRKDHEDYRESMLETFAEINEIKADAVRERDEAEEAIRMADEEFVHAGIEFQDPRVGYKTMQLSVAALEEWGTLPAVARALARRGAAEGGGE